MTQVTDPRGLATTYTVNGFDETTQRVSPDTGTTDYTYDAAGNLTSRTDANGVAARYYYDALNRLTAISFGPSQNENAAFSYDQGTHGVGHLTGYSNGYDQTSLAYDVLGRITSQTSTIDATGNVTKAPGSGTAPSFTVIYGYDAAGNLTYLGYPDGLRITYTRDAAGRVTAVDTWSGKTRIPIATAISWQPFGPLASLSFANGLTETRSYTQDGWLSSLVLGSPALVNKSLGYDAAGNVTAITDNLDGADSQGFGYDAFNELTSASGAYGALGYGYDSDGNRITLAAGTATSGYGYASDNNWLLNVTGAHADTFQYDADGNVTAEGGSTSYGYDAAGRLVTVDGGARASYGYNALGERVSKIAKAGHGMATTLFVYDPAGHLLGEYDSNGAMEKEYIWLRNRPLAVVTPTGTYYIQTDQRDAPRTLTDSSGSVVWQWQPTPFGTGQPTGSFTFNLRYPGQYYDAETGNVYNHARYYDPALGRYLESDPIGLAAGVNTYAYVGDNPISKVDPRGLYECTYSISAHSMSCTPDFPWDPSFSSNNYVSGNNGESSCPTCQNNPAKTNIPFHGPIPVGNYNIGAPTRLGGFRRRLTPYPNNKMFTRNQFELHGCPNSETCSDGCIAATTNPVRDLLNNDLSLEEGLNTLTVVP